MCIDDEGRPAMRRATSRRNRRTAAGAAAATAAVVAALVSSCSGTDVTTSGGPGTSGSAAPGTTIAFTDRQVDVDGHKINLSCQGSGPRTVVFLSDVGQTATVGWDQSGVPASVADQAVACTYDRPGIGKSEAGPEPRSVENQVKDLDGLLRASGLPTPVVLAAQGYGTFIARQFAKDHRDAVAGMVLVDPPLWTYQVKLPPGASPGVRAEYGALVKLDQDLGSYGAGALPPPPAPTVVLGVDGSKPDFPTDALAGTSLDGAQPITTLQPLPDAKSRTDDQRQLAQKSPFGSYKQLDGAGAYAQYWVPDAVTSTIVSVLHAKAGR
jgi:pimeloyl-ACP methyl ester carboxylesterase